MGNLLSSLPKKRTKNNTIAKATDAWTVLFNDDKKLPIKIILHTLYTIDYKFLSSFFKFII